jgi:type III secretory pathway component EscV
MPVLLIAIAIIFIVTAIKGNQGAVAQQINSDITGSGGFFVWVGAILLIALIGRMANIPQASKMLVVLIIGVYLISKNGVFSKLSAALSTASAPSATPQTIAGTETNVPGSTVPAATPSVLAKAPQAQPAPPTNLFGNFPALVQMLGPQIPTVH